ncbi:hypothetical protein [Nioella sediminis]|jgi:hypothetical protein|uniref:hypothetical protein n=1 Tax=Nioella sediminis TaxID=1912092 RepID=UPI0008FD8BAD|nr:hypothetical protein [Nioella sediminis]TBX28522.1 hypothetical protein TK43_05015 [Roseovarius sp. JS7-11]
MRILFCLFLMTGAALADPCTQSPRAFWSEACSDPLTRAVTLEMEALITEVRETPGLHPGTWAALGLRAEVVYGQLDDCLGTNAPAECILPIAARHVAELLEGAYLNGEREGLARGPVDLLCPEFARPFHLTRFDTDPAMIWISPGYALLTQHSAARNVVYGGRGAEGTIDLGITPAGQVVLTGLSARPMPCMIADDSLLR